MNSQLCRAFLLPALLRSPLRLLARVTRRENCLILFARRSNVMTVGAIKIDNANVNKARDEPRKKRILERGKRARDLRKKVLPRQLTGTNRHRWRHHVNIIIIWWDLIYFYRHRVNIFNKHKYSGKVWSGYRLDLRERERRGKSAYVEVTEEEKVFHQQVTQGNCPGLREIYDRKF